MLVLADDESVGRGSPGSDVKVPLSYNDGSVSTADKCADYIPSAAAAAAAA